MPWPTSLLYQGMRTWCDPAGQHQHACNGYSEPTQLEALDALTHAQWGMRRDDFSAASLEKCKAKCSADVRCSAISYTAPTGQYQHRPNCLPTMGEYEGSFQASGWACWRKGMVLDAAAAPDEDAIEVIITTSSSDADYDQLPLPTVRIVSRALHSLVVSPVVSRSASRTLDALWTRSGQQGPALDRLLTPVPPGRRSSTRLAPPRFRALAHHSSPTTNASAATPRCSSPSSALRTRRST